MQTLYIGTSGWSYKHWKSKFYPRGFSQKDWLRWYATKFSTVEINASFYHLPSADTFFSWKQKTPQRFVFSVKAPRQITHWQRLAGCEKEVERFLAHASMLGEKQGPILFQLPPHFPANDRLLAEFLKWLPVGRRYVFEFREASWFCEEVFALLRARGIALCRTSSEGFPDAAIITAPFVYVRMHGARYDSNYAIADLETWKQQIQVWLDQDLAVYIYFNNDANAYAVHNALQLAALTKSRPAPNFRATTKENRPAALP